MTIVVDASVWLGAILSSESNFEATHAWLQSFMRDDGIVAAPSILMTEVAGAYARRTGQVEVAIAYATDILEDPQVRLYVVDDEFSYSAARLAARVGLRAADAIYVALAKSLNVPLVTRDRDQLDRGSALVRTMTPEEMGI